MKKSKQGTPEDPRIEAAQALRETFETFNAGTPTREAITEADEKAIDEINAAMKVVRLAERNPSSEFRHVEQLIEKYFDKARSTTEITAGKHTIQRPAIAEVSVRTWLAKDGPIVTTAIDGYITSVRAELARKTSELNSQVTAISLAMRVTEVRAIIEAWEIIANSCDAITPKNHTKLTAYSLRATAREIAEGPVREAIKSVCIVAREHWGLPEGVNIVTFDPERLMAALKEWRAKQAQTEAA